MGGTLTVQVSQGVGIGVAFSGTGSLPTAVGERYSSSANFTGSGTDSATRYPSSRSSSTPTAAGTLAMVTFQKYPASASDTGSGLLTATADFPVNAAQLTSFTTAGSYTYTIPYWCRYIDVVMIGGGGGGGSSDIFNWGGGGFPGQYYYATLYRGSSGLAMSVATLTGTVGAGGGANAAGGASTCTALSISASGGGGGIPSSNYGTVPNTASVTFNGQTYPIAYGGISGQSTLPNTNPGSGGGGGNSNIGPYAGIPGRAGAVYFRAYQ